MEKDIINKTVFETNAVPTSVAASELAQCFVFIKKDHALTWANAMNHDSLKDAESTFNQCNP